MDRRMHMTLTNLMLLMVKMVNFMYILLIFKINNYYIF